MLDELYARVHVCVTYRSAKCVRRCARKRFIVVPIAYICVKHAEQWKCVRVHAGANCGRASPAQTDTCTTRPQHNVRAYVCTGMSGERMQVDGPTTQRCHEQLGA